jgi:hypothetical protein
MTYSGGGRTSNMKEAGLPVLSAWRLLFPCGAMEAELAPGVHLNCPVGRFICGRANGPQQCSISPPTGRNF